MLQTVIHSVAAPKVAVVFVTPMGDKHLPKPADFLPHKKLKNVFL